MAFHEKAISRFDPADWVLSEMGISQQSAFKIAVREILPDQALR
jgi:hypothetical protein